MNIWRTSGFPFLTPSVLSIRKERESTDSKYCITYNLYSFSHKLGLWGRLSINEDSLPSGSLHNTMLWPKNKELP